MGTYKVPQNVESEDKILGPLSLKQFIYALIGLGYGFITFAIFRELLPIWLIVGIPPMLFMLALGLYQREDQPMETFIIAMAQYFTRPRIRFWEKEPIAEVFKVEPPPPKQEAVQRDPGEVRSQLQQLAELVDTRGWSAKEPEVQEPEIVPVVDLKGRIGAEVLSQMPQPITPAAAVTTEPQVASQPLYPDVTTDDDILDTNSQAAQNLNVLIENTVKSVREEAVEKMRSAPAVQAPPVPGQVIQSAASKKAALKPPAPVSTTSAMTVPTSGDILKLANEGGDLTVAQIAAQAQRVQTLSEGQTVQVR